MNLDDYNKRGRDNDEGEARYAESEASERFSEASSLPEESAPGLATPEGGRTPGDSEFQDFDGSRHRSSVHWGLG